MCIVQNSSDQYERKTILFYFNSKSWDKPSFGGVFIETWALLWMVAISCASVPIVETEDLCQHTLNVRRTTKSFVEQIICFLYWNSFCGFAKRATFSWHLFSSVFHAPWFGLRGISFICRVRLVSYTVCCCHWNISLKKQAYTTALAAQPIVCATMRL